ncbi:hypothetical protein [Sphingomonas kyungheensis]|uniref:Uncharacterized protein n=1 Tax=Sphingomonas kyungheensis TaxID=1069987 RepID=A0ABU8GY18_9SPHN
MIEHEGRARTARPFFVPVTVASDIDLYTIQTQGMRGQSMLYRWRIVVPALAASACAYQPQRTPISTPSSERLQMERRGAYVGAGSVGFIGGLFALRALGIGKPAAEDEANDLRRQGDRTRDPAGTDAGTVPLVLKLPPGLQ